MSARMPAAARAVLERGTVSHVAARTAAGPHLTPVVFVLDGGRLWLTTSRRAVKARAWRADPAVAGVVRVADRAVVFRGVVRTYDALDPWSWPAATLAGPRLVRAATRFGVKNARFFAGYAVDAGRVPLAWSPPGRVFVGVRLTAGKVVDLATGEVVGEWGEWPERPVEGGSLRPLPRRRLLDLRVPRDVRSAIGTSGEGAAAFDAGGWLTVLPTSWRRLASEASYVLAFPGRLLDLSSAHGHVPAALTIDRASAWRASDMAGMLLQGRAEFDPPHARLRPTRVVWWRGWTAGTVSASRSSGKEPA